MRRALPVLALALVCGLAGAAHARLRDDLRGEQLYARECASCHGAGGRGDGPEASYFTPPPRDLREGFLRLYETEELVARIRSGAALDIAFDRTALQRRTRMVDEIAAHLERLPAVRWDDVARGSEIWVERCEHCHGSFGRPDGAAAAGMAKPASDLAAPGVQRRLGDAQVLELAERHGDGVVKLPALPDPNDRRALLAYVRILSPGFELYSVWCAGCHGDDGRGDGDLATGADRPGFAIDRAYLRAQTAAELRLRIVHMLESQEGDMPHLQHQLSEQQVRMIVDYLRATEPSPAAPRRE